MKYIIFLLATLLISCSQESIDVPVVPEKTDKVILALGDSLTAGYGLIESENYPTQLTTKLREKGYNYTLQNAGISGDTTAGLLSRLDWVLEGPSSSLAILCIGANDAFQGKNPEDIEKNLRQIIEKIKAKKIPILFAGMRAPRNLGNEYGKQYAAIFPRLAAEYDLVLMPFLLEGVALQSALNQADRIHPNREGYTIVVDNLMDILESEKLIVR